MPPPAAATAKAAADFTWRPPAELVSFECAQNLRCEVEPLPGGAGVPGKSATVTLNRPHRKNGISADLVSALALTAEWAATHRGEIRVLFLAAAGDVFCAGGDGKDVMAQRAKAEKTGVPDATAQRFAEFLRDFNALPIFTVALVQGACYGGGVGMLCVCDYVVCLDPKIRFTFSEVKLGMIPATICPYVLRKIGYSATRKLFLTGQKFSVAEALVLGLVHEGAGAGGFDREAFIRENVLPCAPGAVRRSKALVEACNSRIADGEFLLSYTADELARIKESPEVMQGFMSVFAKTRPPWDAQAPVSKL